ncbi:MAG: hypothetical protein A2144_01295 [Chloroflexi bacterium RBG_16_50_9]|nr:MAG: hypothetical protein A2144_01295 [Chloroflexi bacterium RBG_16_50_9]
MPDLPGGMMPRDAINFIKNLTGTGDAEIQKYAREIKSDRRFHARLQQNSGESGRKHRYSYWGIGVGSTPASVIYALCRRQMPGIVIETGVASGISSSYFLAALEKNQKGALYSIDMPGWQDVRSGWLIPDYLRPRWHFVLGRSSETLEPLLEQVGEIDIFLHDSDHSYRNMTWEFQTAWAHLKSGGLLLSHNIDTNSAFEDFCGRVNQVGQVVDGNTGGLSKP